MSSSSIATIPHTLEPECMPPLPGDWVEDEECTVRNHSKYHFKTFYIIQRRLCKEQKYNKHFTVDDRRDGVTKNVNFRGDFYQFSVTIENWKSRRHFMSFKGNLQGFILCQHSARILCAILGFSNLCFLTVSFKVCKMQKYLINLPFVLSPSNLPPPCLFYNNTFGSPRLTFYFSKDENDFLSHRIIFGVILFYSR